jgi:hypothetical protein
MQRGIDRERERIYDPIERVTKKWRTNCNPECKDLLKVSPACSYCGRRGPTNELFVTVNSNG